MSNEYPEEPRARSIRTGAVHDVNWTRLEGVIAAGALLASFVWFLGMPTGMAVGVGFGAVLLLDFLRSLLFDGARSRRARVADRESIRE